MAEIKDGTDITFTKNPFSATTLQLAKLVNTIPDGENWLYELKYDGYRMITYIENNKVRIYTRNGNDYTAKFQSIAASLLDWADSKSMVLDGEMTVVDSFGKTDFQALQNHMRNPNLENLTYIIFDLLAINGTDLRNDQLIDRKERLEALMQNAPHNLWYSRHVRGNGKESLIAACEMNAEGIVGKRADSVYSGTRNGDWIKLKCKKRQEFVIGGYSVSSNRKSGVSALLLGIYEGEDFIYAGRVGTGFNASKRRELEKEFQDIQMESSPFKQEPHYEKTERVVWLKPERVAEIRFAAWTKEHRLRQASFIGLRTDKNPKEIIRERSDHYGNELDIIAENEESPMKTTTNGLIVAGIQITHPDKIVFSAPEFTKGDVARYYESVASRMLPYVSRRILSIVRCPQGINKPCFFKKHPNQSSKGIIPVTVSGSEGAESYFYIEDVTGLISEVQMGTLEFHIWGSRIETLEQPDVMIFDLDPDEGMDLATIRQGIKDLLSILDELSLKSFLKTSGGKGYHVVIPFEPTVSWAVFHDFAKSIADVMEGKWPHRYTANSRKAKRKGKIFIDWLRNGRGATSIAPYALRARKESKVSMPIHWDELDAIAPNGIDPSEALKRLTQDDPWKDFFGTHQLLK
jgi:bifunctional non-homologous end joining protein LigD